MSVTMQLAEGDLVATRWVGRGTHEGDLIDIEPTGKEVTVTGLTISRLENGKISEEFRNWDFYGMIRQVEGASARVRA